MKQKKTKMTVEHKELLDIFGGWRKKAMNLVQSISKEDNQFKRKKREIVHLLLKKKNTFVTVTDARGNKKTGASAGCLGFKGRSRRSRYAAQATAEHVGRSAINPGLMKSVVMKVKGSTYFRKKKKVILSWRKGYNECKQSKGDPSKMKYIRDVTQLPHNGCRLPRKRRV